MAEIPKCANFLEGSCERSDTFIDETRDGKAYIIVCRNCKSVNVWSRSNTTKEARAQIALKKRNEASASDRHMLMRAKKFYMPGKSVTS